MSGPNTPATRIIFVRHGETRHNVDLVITSGAPGGPLTDRGAQQARERAEQLRGTQVAALYSSPLRRAAQTAEILGRALGLTPTLLDELRECAVGTLEGKGDPDSFARFDSTWERWYHLTAPDLDYPLGPEGESGRSAVARIAAVVDRIVATHPGQSVVVVGHGTVLQLALTQLSDNLPCHYGNRRWIANAGTVVVDATADGLFCREWSGTRVEGQL